CAIRKCVNTVRCHSSKNDDASKLSTALFKVLRVVITLVALLMAMMVEGEQGLIERGAAALGGRKFLQGRAFSKAMSIVCKGAFVGIKDAEEEHLCLLQDSNVGRNTNMKAIADNVETSDRVFYTGYLLAVYVDGGIIVVD
ncbi:hypothetical protein CEUSTIGMA_g13848.t1, partial [Chlamydomonas eustigma]